MIDNQTLLYRIMRFATIFAILVSLAFPQALASYELYIAAILIVLLGIPHGATDHLIFRQLSSSFLQAQGLQRFYLYYVTLMAVYGLLWWALPALALAIFLGISIYHFGQSNWAYVQFYHKNLAVIAYVIWGTFVLLMPILWHYEAAAVIIKSIIGKAAPEISSAWRTGICISLLFVNVAMAGYFRLQNLLSKVQFRNELLNLGLLTLLFLTTPLLLGFTIYFVVWHSFGSAMDQIRFFQTRFQHYDWRKYAWHTLPLSFAAITGLGMLFWIKNWLGLTADIGVLFIFIAVVTLPHMLLIEQLYHEWKSDTLYPSLKMDV